MAVQSYRDLDVWQSAMDLARKVYKATKEYPKDEQYGLVSQIRRCSVSVPSNLAEGHARLSTKDFHRHVSICLGSLAELETQLILSIDFDYLSADEGDQLLSLCGQVGRQLRGLAKSLQAKISTK